jgi:acetylornithine deacetylase
MAELFIRLVDDGNSTRVAIAEAVNGLAEAKEILVIPAVHMEALEGFETTVVSYTTDIPAFGDAWGRPLLFGPGSIHFAHTDSERVPKAELLEAVEIYQRMVRQLATK